MIKVTLFREKCLGCAYCAEIAPEYWKMSSEDAKAILHQSKNKNGVYVADFTDNELDILMQFVEICPVKINKFQML